MKRAIALILALLTLGLPVFADGETASEGPDEFVAEIMDSYSFPEGNYAIGFRSLYDGETWYYNEEAYFEVCSVYKLPLNMYFYELENAGELESDAIIGGMSLDRCHEYSLEYSNNDVSQAMIRWIGSYAEYKTAMLKYLGCTADEVPDRFFMTGEFNAKQILNALDYLYAHSDTLGEEIDHLLVAQPDQYLESGELDCPIAQKYGYDTIRGTLYIAVAGIVFAEEPFLITVLTKGNYTAIHAMGELCDAFAEWDAGRTEALKTEAEAERQAAELREKAEHAALDAAFSSLAAVGAVSPLPSLLPWHTIGEELEALFAGIALNS